MNSFRVSRRVRTSLFLSATAILGAQPALANGSDAGSPRLDISEVVREAHGGAAAINAADVLRESYMPSPQTYRLEQVAPEPEILIANPNTPTTARDPVNINGVGQMVIDNRDGTIGLCTGTLINPRTVIFAAHCVNSRDQTAYGANSGGTAIGWGFGTNNNVAGASAFGGWLNGVSGGARYQTNAGRAMYNSNWVAYNQFSLEPDAQGFLYGDVAMSSLDTPAAGIPTWALLFSPLTNTGTIGAAGTGFNVGITGYGNNGTGTSGTLGIDYRRRAAENVLGALTDLETFEGFLFGRAPNGLTQNLYFLDFDDPLRGQLGASPFDFNAFRDNARPGTNGQPSKEGITSQGDSGGPLILQNFAQQFVIGVLSGGYSRFFNGQPASGYGTVSFYQPLYLYWDWVAANNPYHYVTASAGDGQWTDASRWKTTLDPAYYVLSNGTPTNGIPGAPGEQKNGTSGDFGQICFQSGGTSDCLDTRTGVETVEARAIGTDGTAVAGNNAGSATTGEVGSSKATREGMIDGVQAEAQATAQALPTATLANGLPGATNFVPNNVDPVRTAGTAPRYFDVTLAAKGTTTLSGANITIDRLTIGTADAGLVIASGASLTTLINTSQLAGTNTVNGTLTSVGDYSLAGGALLGTGTINAPYVSSIAGRFAPGTVGTVGTLTINGNLQMSSGTTYLVDLAAGSSDLIAVKRVNGASGLADLGGQLALNFTNALRGNTSYTILTAEGGFTANRFAAPSAISAILTPTLSYTANSVVLNITAGSYTNVVSPANPVAYVYARLLDANRVRAAGLDGLYGPLDLQNAATIVSTLSGLAPAAESTVQTLGFAAVDSNSTFIRNRLSSLDPANLGGTLASYGQPVQVAALSLSPMGGNRVASDMAAPTMLQEGALPETMSAFVSGGYINGDGRGMTGIGGRDKFDGWYIGGGIEAAAGDDGVIGFAFSYTDLDGTSSFIGNGARGKAYQGTLYGKSTMGGLTLDAIVTAGLLDSDTKRAVNFLGTPYTLRSSDQALIVSSEVGLSGNLGSDTFEIAPRIAGRATHIGFGSALESGGPMALNIRREAYNSYQGRAGITFAAKSAGIRPFVTGTYVHEFADQPATVLANFVGGPGGVRFALNGEDKDWAELSGGLTLKTGNVDLSISADTTLERSDLKAQTYRGSVTFHF